jgi:hypothetical protein
MYYIQHEIYGYYDFIRNVWQDTLNTNCITSNILFAQGVAEVCGGRVWAMA